MEVKDFDGNTYTLTGVDRTNEIIYESYSWSDASDSQVIRFELNGTIFMAMEDNNDGYRSAMNEIKIIKDGEIKNKIPEHIVYAKMRKESEWSKNDTIVFYDSITNDVVLAVGTDNWDDYYPSFVCEWDPTNLAINKEPILYNMIMREKKLNRILKKKLI